MKNLLYFLALVHCLCAAAQSPSPWTNPSYGRKSVIVYAGAGALIKYFDLRHFKSETNYLLKSPVLVAGADFSVLQTSEAWWGLGPYFSKSAGYISYWKNSRLVERTWSNILLAGRITHHHKIFVTKKIDLCSGIVFGMRTWMYHSGITDPDLRTPTRRHIGVAGITATLKYYPTKRLGLYADVAIGYRVDALHFGICHRLRGAVEDDQF